MRAGAAGTGLPPGLGWRDAFPLVGSALLLAASLPPFPFLALPPFVALVPLAVWIERRAADGRRALRGGLLFGVAAWLLLLRWLPVTLGRFLPGALPGWLLIVALLGLLTGGVVWAAGRMRHGAGLPLWAALPLAWTAGEWLRAHLPGSLAFPWLELSTSLAGSPALIAPAEVVGSRGVGLWLVLVNGLLASAWVAWRGGAAGPGGGRGTGAAWAREDSSAGGGPARAVAIAVAAVLTAALPAAWGAHRAATLPTRPALTVAVVQTAISQDVKDDRAAAAEAGLAALERLLPRAAAARPDVVLLPEALLPVRLEAPAAAPLRDRLEAAVGAAGIPVLVGALGHEPAGPGDADDVPYNSLFLVLPDGGLAPARYDKRLLVPVVERVPLPAALGGGDGGRWGNLGFGASAAPIRVAGAGLGPLICLESSFSRAARAVRRAGADVLVNPTNDAWLNGTSRWTRLSALWQHPAHLVVRAVETRTGAARAANTGLSLFVDPDGSVHQRIGAFREGVEVRAVPTTAGLTVFVRLGDVAGVAAAALTLLLLAASFGPSARHIARGSG